MARTFSGHDPVLRRLVAHARSGRDVWLVGLPGFGRTVLLDRAADVLDDEGWSVVRVAGRRGLRRRPAEALSLAGVAPRGTHASAVAGLVAALTEMTRGRAVVVVDDLDDLDEVSAAVIREAASTSNAVVVAASSPGHGEAVHALLTDGLRLQVPPLPYDDITVLVHDVVGDAVDPVAVARLAARSGGSPALVVALAEALRDGAPADQWHDALHLPAEHLLVGLAAPVRDALSVLAAVEPVQLVQATDLVGDSALRELVAASLVHSVSTPTATLVVVYPPLVAEHLRHLASPLLSTQGVGLAAGSDDGAAVLPGLGRIDAAVYGRAQEAQQSARLANARDAWVEAPGATTGTAFLRAALARGGDADVAAAVGSELSDVVDREQVGLRTALATAAISRHDPVRASVLLTEGLSAAEESERHLLTLAELHLVTGTVRNPGLGRVEPLLQVADPVVREVAHVTAAEIHLVGGRPDLALRTLDAIDAGSRGLETRVGVVRGLALALTGRAADGLRSSVRAYASARADFDAEGIHAHGYALALQLGALARFHDLRDHLGAVLTGDLPATVWPFAAGNLSIAGHLSFLERRTVRAASLAAQARSVSPSGPLPGMTTAWACLLEGDGPEAGRRVWEHVEHHLDVGWVTAAVIAAPLAAIAHPDPARAAWFAERLGSTDAGPLQTYTRVVDVLSGAEPDAAKDAAHDLLDGDHPLLALIAARRALHLLRDLGRHTEALEVVEALRPAFRRAGSQIDVLLESVGPVGSLTARERQIAEMASAGATNAMVADRLHLSVRTVENHLRHSYAKLGVQDREGASRVLRSWPPAHPGHDGVH